MARAEEVAAGSREPFFCSGTIHVTSDDGGIQSLHVRVYAEKVADGFAAQVGPAAGRGRPHARAGSAPTS